MAIGCAIGTPFKSGGLLSELISATVENSDATKVIITFNYSLGTVLPDISAFSLIGKTITGVSLDATRKILTITVSVAYAYGDEIGNITYIKPVSNPLRSASGKSVDSFIYPVLNNISSTLVTDLQVYWKLNEASGNRAATVGGLTLTESAASVGTAKINIYDAARIILADGKFLTTADNALLRGGNSDFTIVAHVRPDTLSGSAARSILGKYSAAREYQLPIQLNTSFRWIVSSDGTATAGKIAVLDDANWVPAADTDYLIIAWHDAANDLIGIQVNNYTPSTMAHANGVFGANNAFQIGAINSGSYFDGQIALVAKYSRLLNDNEKKELFNNGIPPQHPFTRDTNLLSTGIRSNLLQKSAAGAAINYASRLNHQRSMFYAEGRYWIFYGVYTGAAPYHLFLKTSTDGTTWSAGTDLTTFPIADAQWDLRYDGTHLHMIKIIQTGAIFHDGLLYRRGTPVSDGTITWDADWQTAIAAGNSVGDPCLCVSDGNVFVGSGKYDHEAFIIKNAATDGTWSTAAGFPVALSEDSSMWMATLAAMPGGGVYASIHKWGEEIKLTGKYSADGGSTFTDDGEISLQTIQGAPEQYVGTEELYGTSDGTIHLVYYASTDQVIYRSRSSAGVWSDEVVLSTTGDTNIYCTCPRLSEDTDGNIYVTWEDGYRIFGCVKKNGVWSTRKLLLYANSLEAISTKSHLMAVENFDVDKFHITTHVTGGLTMQYIMNLKNL